MGAVGIELLHPGLHERLAELAQLEVWLDVMTPPWTSAALDAIRGVYLGPLRNPARTLDACDAPRERVIEWLAGLPIPKHDRIVVIWPACRAAVALHYEDFVQHYDDLWYPSADDVWVTDYCRSWWLEVSHEETLAFFD
jgi:hypothetical protein